MIRRPTLYLDSQALRHNARVARFYARNRRMFAAIKADGYGHGMLRVAQLLSGYCDGFAVATVGEAEQLRTAGINVPILVIQGALYPEELATACALQLDLVFHDQSQIALLKHSQPAQGSIRAWLKVNTGMNRLGLDPAQIPQACAQLRRTPYVQPNIGLMSHFARADQPELNTTKEQCAVFQSVAAGRGYQHSLSNSAALLNGCVNEHWVRPGIMLYGGNPFVSGQISDWGLKPVMQLTTRLIAAHTVKAGARIGYGGRFQAREDMRVGVAAIGYGDGYPRHAVDGTPIAINGQRTRLIGRVSMDLITLDLTNIHAEVGAVVECWGPTIDINHVADRASTISYELMCKISTPLRQNAQII